MEGKQKKSYKLLYSVKNGSFTQAHKRALADSIIGHISEFRCEDLRHLPARIRVYTVGYTDNYVKLISLIKN